MDLNASIKGLPAAALNDLLKPITHRPGFTLEVHPGHWWNQWNRNTTPPPCIGLSMTVVNTYHPEKTIPLSMHQTVPTFLVTVEDFFDFNLGLCMWFDMHECREWFKIDGKPWRDPHGDPYQRFDEREVFDMARAARPPKKTPNNLPVTFTEPAAFAEFAFATVPVW